MDRQQITKISLAWELFQEGVPKLHLARQIGVDRVTIYRWVRIDIYSRKAEVLLAPELTGHRGT